MTVEKEYVFWFSGFYSGCSSNNGCFGWFLYCKVQVPFGISEERTTPIFKMDTVVSRKKEASQLRNFVQSDDISGLVTKVEWVTCTLSEEAVPEI
jgi:hypothetical protein